MEATNQVESLAQPKANLAAEPMQQKAAVLALAKKALGLADGAELPEGKALKDLVTKEVRKAIRVGLFEGIKNGSIKYSKQGKTDGELKKYCSSLINNWVKKDHRFNRK